MTDTAAQDQDNKVKAFHAKAALTGGLTHFLCHWADLFGLLGEEGVKQNGRDEHWRDIFGNIDGTAAESIRPTGEFADSPGKCLEQIQDLKDGVDGYRQVWDDFTPSEEQAEGFTKAMTLLTQVVEALDMAADFVRACLPQPVEQPAAAEGAEVDLTAHEVDAGDDGDGSEDTPADTDDPGAGEGPREPTP